MLFMIDQHLKSGGTAYIATKRFYFGVGGGSATVEGLVSELPSLRIAVVSSFEDGASNIRDIYCITKYG